MPIRESDILRTYHNHPLRMETILARVMKSRGSLDGISELDFALDPETEITDQNHVGGAAFVDQLAASIGIGKHSRVLDLGSGLGGPSRYLAYRFGCRVHGLDISEERVRGAVELTRLAGLGHLVTFECAGFESAKVESEGFDVLWGQGSWVHVSDKASFAQTWARALKPGGSFGMEEAFTRAPESPAEAAEMQELSKIWNAELVEIPVWRQVFEDAGFEIQIVDDLSSDLLAYYAREQELASSGRLQSINAEERKSWELAVKLARRRAVGYFRMVGRKTV